MRTRFTAGLALLGLAITQPAFSQTHKADQTPAPTHKADALFNAGRDLLEAGEYAEACPKFAEANTIAPGLGVTLYLADCYEKLGKTASALQWFRRAVDLAKARGDKREPVAAARALALVPRVPKLFIAVSADAQAQHVEISQDGVRLAPSAWGVSAATDPGDHVLDVAAEGRAPRHIAFHLMPNAETHTEAIGPLDVPPPPPSEVVKIAPPVEDTAHADRTYLTIAIASAGAGVVGIGIGTAFGLIASSKLSSSNDGPCNATNHCTPSGLSLRSSAEHAGNVSTVAFVVGGAAVAAGAIVYLVRPKSGSSAPSVGLSPGFAPGGAGLNIGGAF